MGTFANLYLTPSNEAVFTTKALEKVDGRPMGKSENIQEIVKQVF